nr:T-complex protein 1 subunit beta [Tanacetum cinerariifolium]
MAAERLFKDEAIKEKGERARMTSFVGAMAIADLVKTTLGQWIKFCKRTQCHILAGELLREAEKLVATKIHPMTIISGYRMAADCARSALVLHEKGIVKHFGITLEEEEGKYDDTAQQDEEDMARISAIY